MDDQVVLEHLEQAIGRMVRDGVSPGNAEVNQLHATCNLLKNRISLAAARPLASGSIVPAVTAQPPSQAAIVSERDVILQGATRDYALTGMQVATMHPAPHPGQPNAHGYVPGSRYAIDPPPQVWNDYIERRQRALIASFPHSTQGANDSHWNFWKIHTALWGCTTPIRDNVAAMSGTDPLGHRDELDLAASYIDSRYFTMHAREIWTRAPPAPADP